jgi:sugar/nucleoside kinase (ribokinase family)
MTAEDNITDMETLSSNLSFLYGKRSDADMRFKDAPIDVLGLCNSLMDILVQVDDAFVQRQELIKGVFNPVDEQRMLEVYQEIARKNPQTVPGGCISNAIGALALLGANSAFCGQVGKDDMGDRYHAHLKNEGVHPLLSRVAGTTGCAITLITPDSQRTFAVHLGVSPLLKDISEEHVKNAKILYLSGYALEPLELSSTAFKALEYARKHHVKVALDVADPYLIYRIHKRILEVIADYVDICFANETEAQALFGTTPINALNSLSKLCDIAVVKNGVHGSFVKAGGDLYHADIFKVKAIDTTGAGDVYSAGFLYGLLKGYPLDRCARLGAYCASLIVQKIGARLDVRPQVARIM